MKSKKPLRCREAVMTVNLRAREPRLSWKIEHKLDQGFLMVNIDLLDFIINLHFPQSGSSV